MKRPMLLAGLCGLVAVGGCAQFWSKGYGVEELSFNVDGDSNRLQAALTRKTDPTTKVTTGLVDAGCFNVPVDAGMESACLQQRNAAVAALVKASEDMCQVHLKSIYGNDAYYNIMTGTVATFFSGAAAIAGSASAKSALAAISTFSNAERSLINETVYKNMLVTATSKKIRETRDTRAAALMSPATFGKSTAQYPMVLAVHDVVRYHYSCSFMQGLELALQEGTDSGIDAKKARLENEKRTIELALDNRVAMLSGAQRSGELATDKSVAGYKARIEAIEAQLLVLVRLQTPGGGTEDKPAVGAPPKADAGSLSKAYYALSGKTAAAKTALTDKFSKAKPTDATWAAALTTKANAKIGAVDAALTGACKTSMDNLAAQIVQQQGQLGAATTDDARARSGDKLEASLVQAGRFAARLDAQGASVSAVTDSVGKQIEDAKLVIDTTLNDKLKADLDKITVNAGLCDP